MKKSEIWNSQETAILTKRQKWILANSTPPALRDAQMAFWASDEGKEAEAVYENAVKAWEASGASMAEVA